MDYETAPGQGYGMPGGMTEEQAKETCELYNKILNEFDRLSEDPEFQRDVKLFVKSVGYASLTNDELNRPFTI